MISVLGSLRGTKGVPLHYRISGPPCTHLIPTSYTAYSRSSGECLATVWGPQVLLHYLLSPAPLTPAPLARLWERERERERERET